MSYSDYIYNFSDLNDINYKYYIEQDITNGHCYNMEHHIGRFNSMKKIFMYIKENNIDGDILEFGTWQGHSLYNILYLLENIKIFDKKVVGIDGFTGIPIGYGHTNCPDSLFNDTNKELCLQNINRHIQSFPNLKNNFYILESFYSETNKIMEYFHSNNIYKVCFVHLDCDVVKSCEEALNLMLDNGLLNDIFFIQFDDWGIFTGIPDWFYQYSKNKFSNYEITMLYETRLTKTCKLSKVI